MRITAIAAAVSISAPTLAPRQAPVPVQYVIEARVFAANPAVADSSEVLAAPTFRTTAGRTATLDLSDAKNISGLRIAVTPSDLGAGKVGLKVVVEARRAGQAASSTFDLLAGSDTAMATVALRDTSGAFILDESGRPLFAAFKITNGFEGPFKPGDGVTWPTVVSEAKPEYTAAARAAKVQGVVELEIVVLPDGSVGDVRVTKSLDRSYGLDEAAIAAAKKWRFKPGLRNGVPVATRVGLILEFKQG
jgi:TonB family protein